MLQIERRERALLPGNLAFPLQSLVTDAMTNQRKRRYH
jgi:hypothetical protein